MFETITRNLVRVNLDAPLTLPIPGVTASADQSLGWIELEYRKQNDALYRNGNEVRLFVDERQKNAGITGEKLFWRILIDRDVDHPNELDALLAHPHMIPKRFGLTLSNDSFVEIFFWGARFLGYGSSYVRCLKRWKGKERWYADYRIVNSSFDARAPAALYA
jgi:hypothetical protein